MYLFTQVNAHLIFVILRLFMDEDTSSTSARLCITFVMPNKALELFVQSVPNYNSTAVLGVQR